ncbi:addiction module protein [Carboxylicivirga sp. N1Y90]|uniref:addiction module protein n=1 Tax=Carboxylicivirga fragile TaxID=3417571 RepID=UPI003D33E2CB|nr:addiction module protein [Marinilabiliaceae bacterium N1Y90]
MMQDILKLSVSERILMVEAIWDSIAEDDEKLELSDEVTELLDTRIEAHKNNPSEGSSWADVKARVKKQF